MSKKIIVCLTVALAVAFVQKSDASLQVSITQGGPAYTVLDNGTGDFDPAVGQMYVSTATWVSLGVVDVDLLNTTASSSQTTALARLTETNIQMASNIGTSFTFVASDDTYTGPGNVGNIYSVSNQLAVTGLDGEISASQTSSLDGTSSSAVTLSNLTGGDVQSDASNFSATRTGDPAFELSNSTDFVLGAASAGSWTHTTTAAAVPEPATFVVWGLLACLGACVARVRRNR